MKVFVCIGVLIMSITFSVLAQNEFSSGGNQYVRFAEQVNYGNSEWVVLYQHVALDPILNKEERYTNVLLSNNHTALYEDYGKYQIDSATALMDRNKIAEREAMRLYSTYRRSSSSYLLKNKERKLQTYCDRIFIDRYFYEEPIPTWQWQQSEDTTTICGYLCRKAECSFRGRDWVVWYAEDISLSDGPWKLGGLPGMILSAESKDGEHKFTATRVEQRSTPIVHDHFKHAFKTKRERFNKELKSYRTETSRYIQSNNELQMEVLPLNKRMFYCPLEKE